MPFPLAVLPSPAPLALLVERANTFAQNSRAGSTRRAYFSDFETFRAWCARQGLDPLPATPATVAVYLADLATLGRAPATIERALAGIAHEHRARGFEWARAHPAIGAVMRGIRRELGTAPNQKAPVEIAELAALVAVLGDGLQDTRDRAILTVGWFGAFRRAELVAITVADVAEQREGIVVTLRRSKGDQEGRGAEKGIAYASSLAICPVRSLAEWRARSKIATGPLFRSIDCKDRIGPRGLCDKMIALIVQRTAERAGLDPHNLAGHSLRAGFCTTAARRGKSLDAIMRQTLHKSERVVRRYIRHAKVFDDNASVGLG